ncbi:MAG: xanthine dehydrogenase family protein molybdopterin-binding subunit [Deltaproteobacteria bacterium]|nr:xanthine dehydrogenase family protein molybdopterin-binding subunit [Deltaproteobacteria bacterium]
MKDQGAMRHMGRSIPMREAEPLLRGQGTYVGDLRFPGMLHAAVLRSPHAHARIRAIDVSAALVMPGVVRVLTGADVRDAIAPFPSSFEFHPPPWLNAIKPVLKGPRARVLALDKVRYVGEPVAMVVAEDRYRAEDALDGIAVDYEELPPVVDPEAALEPDAVRIHDDADDNVVFHFSIAKGDVDRALADAPHRIEERLHHRRHGGIPMEGRGVVANAEVKPRGLTVWSSTQVPHSVRRQIASQLGLAEEIIRVVAPHVGGGFGPKVVVYPEEVLVPYLALELGRPVQWIEDRREHFISTAHARDQIHYVELAFDGDGRILALKDRFLLDNGAYNPMGLTDAYNTSAHLQGPYRVPNLAVTGTCVATNKVPNAPYRGAGRPEAVFVMERCIDRIAAELDLDPAEVRFRNFVQPEEIPYDAGILYRDGMPVRYDNGDFPATLRKALDACRYEEVRAIQKEAARGGEAPTNAKAAPERVNARDAKAASERANADDAEAATEREGFRDGEAPRDSRYVGVGIGFYTEGTGVGSFEGARVEVDSSGKLLVSVGASGHGQGHETVFSQLTADLWGVAPEDVTVVGGDTAAIRYGCGTFASRSTVNAGTAIHEATRRLKAKVFELAGHLLEANPDDLTTRDGRVFVAERPDRGLSLAELAGAAVPGWASRMPEGMEPSLEASYYYVPQTVTWAHAAHVVVVEVDAGTGEVELLDYAVAHDSGPAINPLFVEGQVRGGVAQGIGGALYEEFVYDDLGQLLTGTFMDYLMPTCGEIPAIKQVHLETPSPLNPLGLKGIGEGGAIAPPVAVANAVVDALRPVARVEISETPVTPERVLALIRGHRD